MPRIRAATIDQHKAMTRRALLDAAYRIIDEAGTAEVPLGEIALVAGVGRTTFYDYFADRDDVIATMVEDRLPRVIDGLLDSMPEDAPTAERLAELATRTVEFVITDPVFGVILHRELGRLGPEAQRRIGIAHRDLSAEMARLYAAGIEEAVFREMPLSLAGRLIQDTIMSAARALIEAKEPNTHEVLGSLRDFLLGGLGYRG
ncbi:MAG: TetR/AcrR family transcriptional regulator [Actinobacteria bacterium]|nr:TetR/AcrR family transcriptional regulator [Actinomycetota bacterium]